MNRREFLKNSTQTAMGLALFSAFPTLFGCRFRSPAEQSHTPPNAITAQSPNFTRLARAHNQRFHAIVPSAIVLPETTGELRAILKWADSQPDVPIHFRAGGHCFEDFSSGPGVLIDLQRLKQVALDPSKQRVKVGAGVRIGELMLTLSREGLCIPTGSCPSVGVAGLALGGGYGFLSRKLGLTCDNLESAQVLLADERLVTASRTENADLFWACQGGGGGQFGLVTEFEFRVTPLKSVTTLNLTFEADSSRTHEKLLGLWQELAPSLPNETTAIVYSAPGALLFMGWHVGEVAEAKRIFEPFLSLSELKDSKTQKESLADAMRRFGGPLDAQPEFANFKSKSLYFEKTIPAKVLASACATLRRSKGVGLIFDPYGGAIAEVDRAATAFYHRKARMSVQIRGDWAPDESGETVLAALTKIYELLVPFSSGSYVNYCDLDLKDWPRRYWGANAERLSAVKKAYDPGNRFRHRQSIPPS